MELYGGPFVNEYGKYEPGIDAGIEQEEAYMQTMMDREDAGWDDDNDYSEEEYL